MENLLKDLDILKTELEQYIELNDSTLFILGYLSYISIKNKLEKEFGYITSNDKIDNYATEVMLE